MTDVFKDEAAAQTTVFLGQHHFSVSKVFVNLKTDQNETLMEEDDDQMMIKCKYESNSYKP